MYPVGCSSNEYSELLPADTEVRMNLGYVGEVIWYSKDLRPRGSRPKYKRRDDA